MRFGAQAEAFLKLVRSARDRDFPPLREGVQKTAFLVLPWMQTAVPWYSLALALLYRARGLAVEIVFVDTDPPNPAESAGQIPIIERVLVALQKRLPFTRLSAVSPVELSALDIAEIARITELNKIAYLHRAGTADVGAVDNMRAELTRNLRQLHPLFANDRYDHWVVPGGIYGVSGLCVYCGKLNDRRVATYDSGPGAVSVGVRGVAAYCADIAAIFEPECARYVDSHRVEAVALAKKEFELRRLARDRYGYSAHPYEAAPDMEKCDVLFPLNILDDAAGLAGFRYFTSAENWLMETVAYLLAQTNAHVVLREHPGARHVTWSDETCQHVMAAFPGEPRLRFVSCREKVSTYRLLEAARLVLPYSSTVGVEAAIIGKQVIPENAAYYSGLGFVQKSVSKADYFSRIGAALRDPQSLSGEQIEKAWLCYYFGQVVGFVDSVFTPVPKDFESWSRWSFQRLLQETPARVTVDAMSTATPVCRLQSALQFNPPATPPPRKRFRLDFWR